MTNPSSKKTVAVIPSAGLGRRMGSRKKNYLTLLDRPVLAHTLAAFENASSIDSVIIVVPPGDERYCRDEIVSRYGFKKVTAVVAGGPERQDSVKNGIRAAGSGFDIVAVHDGARPLVTPDIIDRTIKAALEHGAAIAAVAVKDTVKESDGGFVRRTVPREALLSVQTPQAFAVEALEAAFKKAREDGFIGTDESSLVERTGKAVRVVEGSYENIKITTPEDMAFAECILKKRLGTER
jgi:2-C-methyl-D-erythritol 4-phosphate cytidylyltransferase